MQIFGVKQEAGDSEGGGGRTRGRKAFSGFILAAWGSTGPLRKAGTEEGVAGVGAVKSRGSRRDSG